MSHSTNSNLNFCDICNLSFNLMKGFLKHTLLSGEKRTRDKIMDLDEAETASPPQPQPKPKSTPLPVGETRLALQQHKPKSMPNNMERVYDPEEDDYILVPKKVVTEPKRASPPAPHTKSRSKFELETRAKPQIVVPC